MRAVPHYFSAGTRSPFDVLRQWPEYLEGMAAIRKVLVDQVAKNTDLQDLADACGDDPTRAPPNPASVKKARHAVAKVLGLSNKQAELSNPASLWKWRFVKEVQSRTQDPDVAVAEWLKFGVA